MRYIHASIYVGYRRGVSARTTTTNGSILREEPRRDVPSLASRAHWASRSSMMESLMPLPLGKEIIGLLPVPMTKTLVARVANS